MCRTFLGWVWVWVIGSDSPGGFWFDLLLASRWFGWGNCCVIAFDLGFCGVWHG